MKWILVLAMLGCSSSSFPIEESSDSGQDAGGEAAVVDSAVALDTQPALDAAGPDERIDPIANGYSWTYDVQIFGTYPGCSAGTHTGKVLRSGMYQGRNAFEVQSFCPGFGASWYAVEGDVVDLYYKAWLRVVDAPVKAGHSWSNGAATVTWRDEGKVTTAAGTFEDCFRAEVSASSFTVFCRGVGPVRWYVKDAAGNGYEAKLVAKGF